MIAKLKLLLDLTQIISSYNLLRNNNKFNCNTKSYYNTNKNVFLKHLATKTIESKKITLLLYYTKYWLTRTVKRAVNINY